MTTLPTPEELELTAAYLGNQGQRYEEKALIALAAAMREPVAWIYPRAYGSGVQFPKPVKPQGWDDEEEWKITPLYAAPPAQTTCINRDGTGDVHDQTGEWRGSCTCEAGLQRKINVQDKEIDALKTRIMHHEIALNYYIEVLKTRNGLLAELEAENTSLKKHLSSIERFANHHGQHPDITPQEALGMIQHYPPIKAITRSYADGVVPNTPDPWVEMEALRKDADCSTCANRGKVNDLTQYRFCATCTHQQWLKDPYVPLKGGE